MVLLVVAINMIYTQDKLVRLNFLFKIRDEHKHRAYSEEKLTLLL